MICAAGTRNSGISRVRPWPRFFPDFVVGWANPQYNTICHADTQTNIKNRVYRLICQTNHMLLRCCPTSILEEPRFSQVLRAFIVTFIKRKYEHEGLLLTYLPFQLFTSVHSYPIKVRHTLLIQMQSPLLTKHYPTASGSKKK